MKTLTFKNLTATFALAFFAIILNQSPQAQAGGGSWCPLKFDDCSVAEKAFYITFSPILLPVTSVGLTSIAFEQHKISIAQAAIEDIAVYYDQRRVTGILPATLPQAKLALAEDRGLQPSEITEAEAVEYVARAAATVIDP